jgi:rRNA maturation protein Nop10
LVDYMFCRTIHEYTLKERLSEDALKKNMYVAHN